MQFSTCVICDDISTWNSSLCNFVLTPSVLLGSSSEKIYILYNLTNVKDDKRIPFSIVRWMAHLTGLPDRNTNYIIVRYSNPDDGYHIICQLFGGHRWQKQICACCHRTPTKLHGLLKLRSQLLKLCDWCVGEMQIAAFDVVWVKYDSDTFDERVHSSY